MRVLFLITARGGSKSVPHKNLLEIAGISLVGFKAISARKSQYCARLIISSDSPEIQANARQYGVEVPFTRPAKLATDTASSNDVILHALDFMEQRGEIYDAVMLLEPSSPFATYRHFDEAIELLIANKANVVVGVRETEVSTIFQGPLDGHGRLIRIIDKMQQFSSIRRQDVAPEYTMNGALYVFRWNFFKQHRKIYCDRENTYGYIMPRPYSIEVDEPLDYEIAKLLVELGQVDLSYWRNDA